MVDKRKAIDTLLLEYKEWLSRQRYWAKLVIQSITVLLTASAISVSILGSKESLYLLAVVLVIFVVTIIIPSAWIYFYFRKISMKRLREIEETLDEFGIHLGYQRTFDKVPIPKYEKKKHDRT